MENNNWTNTPGDSLLILFIEAPQTGDGKERLDFANSVVCSQFLMGGPSQNSFMVIYRSLE